MTDHSSEKIAKALKGAGLSAKKRIEKAYEAWNDDSIFFPNKDDFLFEWLCTALSKPNMKKLDDCSLIQLPYWKLLVELLEHYKVKQQPAMIHINMVLCVSNLLQQLYKQDQFINDTETRFAFLKTVHRALDMLFSDEFNLAYRPAFEHVSAAVDQVLTVILEQMKLAQDNKETETDSLYQLSSIGYLLLKKFDGQLVLAANQKKVYTSIVDKSLKKLLSVRRRISLLGWSENGDKLTTILTTIICHALFHADTVLEYTSVLKDVNSMDAPIQQNNYVAKIFDVLDKSVKDGQDDPEGALDALDITPVLFSAFLEAFRQKRNTSTSAMQDTSRMAEFGFFVYMLKIIHHSEDLYLDTLSRLLKVFVQWNVYHSRNDEITQSQKDILNQIADEIVSYLDNNNAKQYNQGLVLNVADVLLQTDFSLIETRMSYFWPVILNPDSNCTESCMQFAKSILSTYSASRQLDSFIEDLIYHIEQLQVDDLYTLLHQPMFSKEFLNTFSASITKHTPPAQYINIFNYFSEKIISNMTKFKSDEPAKKKQKTNSNHNGFTIRLIGIYFIEYLNALRLNQHQRSTFESVKLYTDFIQPSMDIWRRTKEVECAALPAIQIHFALVNVFYETYLNKLEQQNLRLLAAAYEEIYKYYLNKKESSLGSRLALIETVNAMLQSIYYHSLFPEKHIYEDGKIEALNLIIAFLTENKGKKEPWYQTAKWNGNILDINDINTVKLVCWKLLVDEWFEAVVNFIDVEEAKKLVDVVFMSLTANTSKNGEITAQVLNTILLRSANFYEVQCFKDCNVKAVLAALTDLFNRKLVKSSSSTISRTVAEMIINNTSKSDDKLDQALKEDDDIMEQDVNESSTENVVSIISLMRLLLLFPNEYYEKNERQIALNLATLVDMWIVSCVDADPVIRAKSSLVCRSLYLRFIDFFSVNSLLGTNSSVLKWLTLSADKYYHINNTDNHILHSLEQVTNTLDKSIIHIIMAATNTESTLAQSVQFLQDTLKQSVDDLLKKTSQKKSCLNRISNILEVVNQVLQTRKSAEIDLDNVIYAKDMVATVSEHLDTMLKSTNTTISKLIKQIGSRKEDTGTILSSHIHEFGNIRQVLHLTRLIQIYAKIIGPDVDQTISAKEQSSSLTSLTSLFVEFLTTVMEYQQQSALDMVTEFTVALCSILPRYQENATQHTLDTVWFVYSMMLNTNSDEAIPTLSVAFSTWIQSLDEDQFDIVIQKFMEQSQKELNEKDQLAFLSLLAVLLKAGSDVHKKQLGKTISTFILKLSLMAGKTRSLKFFQQVLKFLFQISNSQTYHLTEYDVSLLLSCLFQVAHPTALQRFKTEMNQSVAHEIFDDVCAVLSSLIGQRKEQVVDMLPPLIAFIQSLMHCFKSTHVSLVGNANHVSGKKRKHVDNNNKAQQNTTEQFGNRTVPLLVSFAPLNDTSAQKFSRLLSILPSKQSTTGRSAQSLYKTIAKHTPSIIIEYFHIQSNSTMSIIQPTKKSIFVNALYDVFDMCNDSDRSFIMSCLDGSGKSLFKSFYSGWKETHKYSGE